ncbi:zinc-binding dehydrogenase-domain-containing protein [Aspergillus spectabilis]
MILQVAGKKKKVSKNKCVAEPITDSITEPITKPITEPIVEPVAEPPPHNSKIDYNQPQSCPYISSNIIRIVIQGMEYHIPDCYIKQYNQLKCNPFLFPPTIALDDIDGDIGHTVVHFLCTGQYETLSSAPDENSSSLDLEYRRSVQTYHAARTHGLHGLENLAIKYIRSGMWVVQLAKIAGATVVGTCGPDNIEVVKSLGADEVLNYRSTDIKTWSKTPDAKVDIVLDCIGRKSLTDAWWTVKEGGTMLSIFQPPNTAQPEELAVKDIKDIFFIMEPRREHLQQITKLIEEGKAQGYVDSVWLLEQFGEAFKRVEGGHARGKVIIDLSLNQ